MLSMGSKYQKDESTLLSTVMRHKVIANMVDINVLMTVVIVFAFVIGEREGEREGGEGALS